MMLRNVLLFTLLGLGLFISAGIQAGQLKRSIADLIVDLKKSDKDKFAAMKELGELGEKAVEAVPALIDLLTTTKNEEVRLNAALALGKIGKPAVEALNKAALSQASESEAAMKKRQEQLALLKLAEENARKLQQLLDAHEGDQKEVLSKLKLIDLQLQLREKEFDHIREKLLAFLDRAEKQPLASKNDQLEAKKVIDALTAERDTLKSQWANAAATMETLKLEADKLRRVLESQPKGGQQFTGMALTGESVIFLIDVSGSMVMRDPQTPDPEKWPFVCDTLVKLMTSHPTMKRFQVILFSDKATYLFGKRDFWLKYAGPETAKVTGDTLRKFTTGGGTNLQEGLDEAFRYRKIGLDTIYLFSDGLPNIGDGLPNNITNPSEEQLNLHLSRFVRDKLHKDWNRPIAGQASVRINTLGFFYEGADFGGFLWALAREHRGSFVGLR